MKTMPPSVVSAPLAGLELIHQGKVRDTYRLPGYPGLLFVVVTDRVSVHDVILPTLVPCKGPVLNMLDIYWRTNLTVNGHLMPSDLVACGRQIDSYLPKGLRENRDLQSRARVVVNLEMYSAEIIIRGLLTGTALSAYKNGGVVCGIKLPDGMSEWDEFPEPLFTPTTKASVGHDEHMTVTDFIASYGMYPATLATSYFIAARNHARLNGFELVDTKLEMGMCGDEERVADEVFTPDSSRFVLLSDLELARTTDAKPPSFDKQPVRDWATRVHGLDAKTELTDELVTRVHALPVELGVIETTSDRYCELFQKLTGRSITEYC